MFLNFISQTFRKCLTESGLKEWVCFERWETSFLGGKISGGFIGFLFHEVENLVHFLSSVRSIITKAKFYESVSQSHNAQPNTADIFTILFNFCEWVGINIQNIIKEPYTKINRISQCVPIKIAGIFIDVLCKVDGPKVTTTIGFKPNLTTRVCGDKWFVIMNVIHFIGKTNVQDSGFSGLPSILHDEVPNFFGWIGGNGVPSPNNFNIFVVFNCVKELLVH